MSTNGSGKEVLLKPVFQEKEKRLGLFFKYDEELIGSAKAAGAKWSPGLRCWHLPDGGDNMKKVFAAFKGKAWVNADAVLGRSQKEPVAKTAAGSELEPQQHAAIEKMRRKLEIGRYSLNTIETYLNAFKQFLLHFPEKHPNDLRTDDIETYQHHLAKRQVSNSYLNQIVNAIRYFYKDVLGDAQRVKFIERPRKEKKLPVILSKTEVSRLLSSIPNLKHQTMLSVTYSGGLRMGEVLSLRMNDILFDRGLIRITAAKGNKDRVTLLGKATATLIKRYLEAYKPTDHLFPGQNGGRYSERSLQK